MTLPDRFQQLIRSRCRFITPAEALDPEASLTDLGIDSLEIVEIIVDIEDAYGIEIPLEMLTPEMFATPATIWLGLGGLITQAADPATPQP